MNHDCMSAMHRSANSVEKMHVFWPWSSLRMSACTVPRTFASTQARTSAASSSDGARPCSASKAARRWSTAVLRNIASTAGAGPLIVMDTDVVGEHRSKPPYSTCMSSSVAIETPEVPTLP